MTKKEEKKRDGWIEDILTRLRTAEASCEWCGLSRKGQKILRLGNKYYCPSCFPRMVNVVLAQRRIDQAESKEDSISAIKEQVGGLDTEVNLLVQYLVERKIIDDAQRFRAQISDVY